MTAHPRGFASDNYSGAHPDVLAAIAAANDGHAPAYGDDDYTATALRRFREHFGEQAEAFLVFNGSGANVLALQALARPARGGHLHRDRAPATSTSAARRSGSPASSC